MVENFSISPTIIFCYTSFVNTNAFEEGKTIHTGKIDGQPQALIDFLYGENGLDAHLHTAEKTKWGWYLRWDNIEGIFDMEYEVPEKSEWMHPYICRSKVHIKVKVEFNKFEDGYYYKVYRLDENNNVI